jgi:hypothetical protein
MYVCKICEQVFDAIPPGSTELTLPSRNRTSHIVKFADGSIHNLKSDAYHVRHHLHLGRIKKDCKFCELAGREKAEAILKQAQPESVVAPEPPQVPPTIDRAQDNHSDGSGTDFEHLQEDPVVPEDTPVVEEHPGSTSMRDKLFRQQEESESWKDDSIGKF